MWFIGQPSTYSTTRTLPIKRVPKLIAFWFFFPAVPIQSFPIASPKLSSGSRKVKKGYLSSCLSQRMQAVITLIISTMSAKCKCRLFSPTDYSTQTNAHAVYRQDGVNRIWRSKAAQAFSSFAFQERLSPLSSFVLPFDDISTTPPHPTINW